MLDQNEKRHKCLIGRKSTELIVSSSSQVNIVSSALHGELVAGPEFACAGYEKVHGIVADIHYEGVLQLK